MIRAKGAFLSAFSKKIAVVDDHALFLAGITQLIAGMDEGFSTVAFSDGVELIRSMDAGTQFDLIITDLSMTNINGLMLVKSLRTKGFSCPIVIVSGVEKALSEAETLAAGADRFVHKGDDFAELAATIEDVLGLTHRRAKATKAEAIRLAPRQQEILLLLSTGASNGYISAQLDISENTVKTHLKNMYLLFGARNRLECVQKAASLGLLKLG